MFIKHRLFDCKKREGTNYSAMLTNIDLTAVGHLRTRIVCRNAKHYDVRIFRDVAIEFEERPRARAHFRTLLVRENLKITASQR